MFSVIKAYKVNDPAAKSSLEILLLYPGIRAMALYRLARSLYKIRLFFFARLISEVARLISGIEIHPGAKIGRGVVIDHGMGVVIGETAVIGNNVLIYHGVTLGGSARGPEKRHPTIKDNVILGAGCKIIGPIIVGEGSKVGANAVVLQDVAPHTSVGGVPSRVLSTKN
jgi:serine O-acetyltransferase